jgi:hypothetical protein
MHTLMSDPMYRAYMKRVPATPHSFNTSGEPWQVWVETPDHKWRTKNFATYQEVWPVWVKYFRMDGYDPTITSRRVFYAPPGEYYKVKVRKPRRPTPDNAATIKIVIEERWRQLFFWDGMDLEWCGRCRRPVYWLPLFADHHALKRYPAISEEDNRRCTICGIRKIAMPPIAQMEK